MDRPTRPLEIYTLMDEPTHFRLVRVGHWTHFYSYETGQGEWNYDPIFRPHFGPGREQAERDFEKLYPIQA